MRRNRSTLTGRGGNNRENNHEKQNNSQPLNHGAVQEVIIKGSDATQHFGQVFLHCWCGGYTLLLLTLVVAIGITLSGV